LVFLGDAEHLFMEPSEFMSDMSLEVDATKRLVVLVHKCFAYGDIINDRLYYFLRHHFHTYLK
jgi:hypothetical protein